MDLHAAALADRTPLEPETVLPAQIAGGARYDADLSPELALRLAILEDAIRCARGPADGPRVGRRQRRDARAWLAAVDPRWPFSFVNVCDALGFDAGAVRAAVLGPASGGAAVTRPRMPRAA